jgi:diaminopimelate epimerase
MGIPELDGESEFYEHVSNESKRVLGNHNFEVTGCRLSNQHIVVQTNQEFSIELLRDIGPRFQTSAFWDGINVHLVKTSEPTEEQLKKARSEIGFPISELIQAASWERGAGETAACGSGACAIGAIALNSGFLDRAEWVGVQMPGGLLYVKQDDPAAPIQLAGPAQLAFDGIVEI